MKSFFTALILLTILSSSVWAQEKPKEKLIQGQDKARIEFLLKMVAVKYDSLMKCRDQVRIWNKIAINLESEITTMFNKVEIEILTILGRYGYNPDIYTISIRDVGKGKVELKIVEKESLPQKNSSKSIQEK